MMSHCPHCGAASLSTPTALASVIEAADAVRHQFPSCGDVEKDYRHGGILKAYDLARAALSSAPQPAARPSDDDLWDQTLQERDDAEAMCDKLAGAIAKHLGEDIGEHSSANFPWENALEAIENAQPAAPEAGMRWIPVSERMPASGVNVLACYRNIYGKHRCIRAFWAAPRSMEATEEDNCGAVEETDDGDFLRSGWYESNENDETSWGVSDPVTHWMPLPAAPREGQQSTDAAAPKEST
jgi:hypothetical protein